MLQAERSDVRVVNEIAGSSRSGYDSIHDFRVAGGLGEEEQGGALEQGADRTERMVNRERGVENPRMGGDTQELVDAWPGDRPWQIVLGEEDQKIVRGFVLGNRLDVRGDQNVRVDRAQLIDLP